MIFKSITLRKGRKLSCNSSHL